MKSLAPLSLRPRGAAKSDPVRTDGRWQLEGRTEWLIEGPQAMRDDIARALPGIAEDLGVQTLLNFGNTVGRFDVPHLGAVEVYSSKWTSDDFDRMLRDVSRIAAQLPFTARVSGSLPYDRSLSTAQPVLYHLFSYLRWVLIDDAAGDEALIPALATIVRDPHRRLLKAHRATPLALARDIRPAELQAIACGVRPTQRAVGPMLQSPIARALGGRVPDYVREAFTVSTLDTPENRFVKAFLDLARGIIDQTKDQLSSKGAFGAKLSADCAQMRRRLEPFRRAGMWQEVGALGHFPVGSTVLQGRRGYKGVLRSHVRLRLGSQLPVNAEESRRLLEIRDIAELYELWCYFRMVEAVAEVFGRPTTFDRPEAFAHGLEVPWDFVVRWRGGLSLFYNRRFSRSRALGQRSYSVPLRPDIVLEVSTNSARELHIFDAKFRLDRLEPATAASGSAMQAEEDDDLEATGLGGTFKKPDLYKMHAYRDAIPRARSAWILYPGSESRFFDAGAGAGDGVGALALVPGGNTPELLDRLFESIAGTYRL